MEKHINFLVYVFFIYLGFVKLVTSFDVNPNLFNATSYNTWGYTPGLATWYGDPNGPGSGGACGFADDVAYSPYNGMISAGNNNIFLGGKGCGTCYKVQCLHPYCNSYPIQVTITDQCPGTCNSVPYHFDLSGIAFGSMARSGLADNLRNLGQVPIVFSRVPCFYPGTRIAFQIEAGSNPYYMAVVIEYENGEGDLDLVELGVDGKYWLPMQRSWGAVWTANVNPDMKGPFSIKLSTIETKNTAVAYNVIPDKWVPGKKYWSTINLS